MAREARLGARFWFAITAFQIELLLRCQPLLADLAGDAAASSPKAALARCARADKLAKRSAKLFCGSEKLGMSLVKLKHEAEKHQNGM